MKPIQFVLILLLCVGFVCYLRIFRSKLLDRLAVLLLFGSGTFIVLSPDSANDLAHLFGVTRGADLVIYLTLCLFGYLWLIVYTKIRTLERQNTELVRALAIENASRPEHAQVERTRKAG